MDDITATLEEFSGTPSYPIECTGNSSGVATVPITATETASAGRFKLILTVTNGNAVNTWPSAGPLYVRIIEL